MYGLLWIAEWFCLDRQLVYRLKGKGRIFAIACSVEGSDQFPALRGDTHFAICQSFMIEHLMRLGIEHTRGDRSEEMDRGIYGESQLGMAVGRGRKGQVGQGEKGSPLTDPTAIQVLRFDLHTGLSVAVAHIEQLYASP